MFILSNDERLIPATRGDKMDVLEGNKKEIIFCRHKKKDRRLENWESEVLNCKNL